MVIDRIFTTNDIAAFVHLWQRYRKHRVRRQSRRQPGKRYGSYYLVLFLKCQFLSDACHQLASQTRGRNESKTTDHIDRDHTQYAIPSNLLTPGVRKAYLR